MSSGNSRLRPRGTVLRSPELKATFPRRPQGMTLKEAYLIEAFWRRAFPAIQREMEALATLGYQADEVAVCSPPNVLSPMARPWVTLKVFLDGTDGQNREAGEKLIQTV